MTQWVLPVTPNLYVLLHDTATYPALFSGGMQQHTVLAPFLYEIQKYKHKVMSVTNSEEMIYFKLRTCYSQYIDEILSIARNI